MTASLRSTLEHISLQLFAGSMNYQVSFLVAELKYAAGQSLQKLRQSATGKPAFPEDSRSANSSDVVEALRDALSYERDDGSHPSRLYMQSPEFRHDSDIAISQLRELVDSADTIISFSLVEGHPFYPVFWDFAFVIEKGDDAVVFIGSSSD